MSDHGHLDRELQDAVTDLRVSTHVPQSVRRRIHVYQAGTVLTALVTIAGLTVAASFVGDAFSTDDKIQPGEPIESTETYARYFPLFDEDRRGVVEMDAANGTICYSLDSLENPAGIERVTIVADNGSTDESMLEPVLQLLPNEEHFSPAAGDDCVGRVDRGAMSTVMGDPVSHSMVVYYAADDYLSAPLSQGTSQAPIVVTREGEDFPDGCGVMETGEVVKAFTDAMSAGDLEGAISSLTSGNEFEGLYIASGATTRRGSGKSGGTSGPDPHDPEAVRSYLEDRISHSDLLDLTEVRIVIEGPPGFEVARADFLLTRSADDISSTSLRGYAQIRCSEKKIHFFNAFFPSSREYVDGWCPDPVASLGTVVTACAGVRKSLVFPTQPGPSGYESAIEGTLVRRGRCLMIDPPKSTRFYVPVWPPGFTYTESGDNVTVLDLEGDPVVELGGRIELGGGRYASTPQGDFKDAVQNCPAPYWLVGVIEGH